MPHIGVALRLQMVMADHHVVDILNLEGLVIEAVLFALNAEEDAVVDKGLAGVCGGSSTTPISGITTWRAKVPRGCWCGRARARECASGMAEE